MVASCLMKKVYRCFKVVVHKLRGSGKKQEVIRLA